MSEITEITKRLDTLVEENKAIKQENQSMMNTIQRLVKQVDQLQSSFNTSQQVIATYDERHATILSELNSVKESMMDIYPQKQVQQPALTEETSMRSIPAPSKVMIDEQKKKDNRLVELRRITKEYMHVDDGEAALRLYKLQKTMIHVVADLKKYMKSRGEDISKSWKSIDMSTQRVAFEMVEREATSLGVPLNMCIGYWGARRLISKSWANALRTTKKHIKTREVPGNGAQNPENSFEDHEHALENQDSVNNNTEEDDEELDTKHNLLTMNVNDSYDDNDRVTKKPKVT